MPARLMSAGAVLLGEAEQLAGGLGAVGGGRRFDGELADHLVAAQLHVALAAGLVRKSTAPAFMACTDIGMVPWPVMKITGTWAYFSKRTISV